MTPPRDASEDMETTDLRARGLRRMKRTALGLLCVAACLYAVAQWLGDRHAAWGYVAAFAEASMVGAMADWFAVVALFRHPLGIPIPHTAIIPRGKSRIARRLADFLCDHFLGTPQLIERLRAARPAERLACWLAHPAHARRVADSTADTLGYGLAAFDDERVRDFVQSTATQALAKADFAGAAGSLLDLLTQDRRHQQILDEIVLQLGNLLADADVRTRIADTVAAEVHYLRYVGLDAAAGRYATNKIVAAVARIMEEMAADPQHPLRQRFDRYVEQLIDELRHDDAFRKRVSDFRHDILNNPKVASYLRDLWGEIVAWLEKNLQTPDSALRSQLALAVQTLGTRLQEDTAMREWIDGELIAAAPDWIDRYREDIRRYVTATVDAWDTQALTRDLELHIGRDLQFIRINGTLVGGLIGLGIHAITQWLRTR